MQSDLTQEDWSEWLLHPVTKVFRELLRRRREDLKDNWARGDFTDQGQFGTAILNARAIGGCTVLEDLLRLDAETVNGEMSHDKDERVWTGPIGPSGPDEPLRTGEEEGRD